MLCFYLPKALKETFSFFLYLFIIWVDWIMELIPTNTRGMSYVSFGNPLQYSCLENPHGQRGLMGYSPLGCKESDTTEQLNIEHTTHIAISVNYWAIHNLHWKSSECLVVWVNELIWEELLYLLQILYIHSFFKGNSMTDSCWCLAEANKIL